MIAALLAGCRPPVSTPTPTPDSGAVHTGHTGAPDPDAEQLRCALEEGHALRGRCVVEWSTPGPLELRFSSPGEDDRVFRVTEDAVRHDVFFWSLVPDTAWTVVATGPTSGEQLDVRLRSGPLPDDFDRVSVDIVTDGGSQVSAVVLAPSCPALYVVAIDRRGRVVWYQDTRLDGGFLGGIDAFALTDRGTYLVNIGRTRLREYTFDGRVVLELLYGVDFPFYVHHDLVGRDGYIWSLSARAVRRGGLEYIVDSVLAFDAATGEALATADFDGLFPYTYEPWMREGFWSQQFPGAIDLTHANALYRDDAGAMWVSFRHLHAFGRFAGDPAASDFGALQDLVVGDDASPVLGLATTTVTGGPGASFTGQHDVHPASDGSVLLLDNGLDRNRPAEASRYTWNEARGTLRLDERWVLAPNCPTQGSVRELDGGHLLATCTSQGLASEFAPGRADPVWSMSLRCGGPPSSFGEGAPLQLPTEPAQ